MGKQIAEVITAPFQALADKPKVPKLEKPAILQDERKQANEQATAPARARNDTQRKASALLTNRTGELGVVGQLNVARKSLLGG